jgi:hypothetical protein
MLYDFRPSTRFNPASARYWFDSLPELQRWLEETPATWQRRDSERSRPSHDWDLGLGWQGALRLAREGDTEGADAIRAMLADYAATLPARDALPSDAHAVAGYHVDVPHYLTGQPDCMIAPAPMPETGRGRVVTLAVSINATADIDAGPMRRYGMALARKVYDLEAAGERVEVIGCFVSEVSGARVSVAWRVKAADRDLDLPALAFAIGHPAMFRRIGFAVRERLPFHDVREDSSYGRSKPARLADLMLDGSTQAPAYPVAILNGMNRADVLAPTIAKAIKTVGESVDAALSLAYGDTEGEEQAASGGW